MCYSFKLILIVIYHSKKVLTKYYTRVSMNAAHVFSFPMHTNPARLDPCVGRYWMALPLSSTILGLWRVPSEINKAKEHPIELTGHSKEVTAINFSNDRIKYLLTACREKILLWNLQLENAEHISRKLIYSMPGDVTALCINNSNDIIAAGVDYKIHLLKEGIKRPLAILRAHKGMVTRLAFCPHYSASLVSLSDDRSFCVWNVQDSLLVFQSKIISSSPLISISMNWTIPQVAVGTADGCLKVFDLTDGNDFRQLSSTNISSVVQKHFEKHSLSNSPIQTGLAAVRKSNKLLNARVSNIENPAIIQASESVLSVEYIYLAHETSCSSTIDNKSSGVGDILIEKPPLICTITTNFILLMNSRTCEIVSVLKVQEPLVSKLFCCTKIIGPLSYAASCQTGPSQIAAIVGTVFERKTEVILLDLIEIHSTSIICSDQSEKSFLFSNVEEGTLSIIPVSTVMKTSPLMCEILSPVVSNPVTKGDVATGRKKLPGIMNQPLTFKSKIKSSGYTQAPRTTMFKPETSRNKVVNVSNQIKANQGQLKSSLNKMLNAEYDVSKGPPVEYHDMLQVDQQGSAVFSLRFSDDGSALGCGLLNSCTLSLKQPFSKSVPTCFIGHNNAVNSVYWSRNSNYLLTASYDKKVLLWNKSGGDPIMALTHLRGTVKDICRDKVSNLCKTKLSPMMSSSMQLCSNTSIPQSFTVAENKLFTKEIKHAQFFYVDKFILLTHGAELLLFKYHITQDRDDVKRYQCQNHCKLVASWQTISSSFTAAAAINTFFSQLVICTTSGRSIEVYDLNKSVLAHTFSECHSRPAHCVTINEGSYFASQPLEAHSVIATASVTDPIKLWDLRTKTNVQALQGHINNAHSCKVAFSPCGNYLASGSENQMVYLFDLRRGTYLDCLRGHNDVVTSVAFHPSYPLIASGSLNGKIVFFKSK